MKKILTALFFVFSGLTAFSQSHSVSGTVTSAEDGSTIAGVAVILEGTTTGTLTGDDGSWALDVEDGTLLFTCLGYSDIREAIGNEAQEYGVDIILAPAINIQRNPLCGRNFEYFSEDPFLTGELASSYINGVQSNNVGTSVKHFAVNNQETLRNGIDVELSERALREIYLSAFERVVRKSSPWTIMSSYNKLNGILASENQRLLTEILRGQEAAQLYVALPDNVADRPAKELKAFAKTPVLEPGESCAISLCFDRSDLKIYDNAKGWIMQDGSYKAFAASSVSDIKATVEFTVR